MKPTQMCRPICLQAVFTGRRTFLLNMPLAYYGLIPEAVYTVTCATFEKKKKKKYETSFGTFTYRDVPPEAFPLGIRLIQEGDYFYRIAEPEKALCDQLYTISPVPNIKGICGF